MELYYVPPENITGNELIFDQFEAQHLLRSMRKKKGDQFKVTDGAGNLYNAHLIESRPSVKASVTLERKQPEPLFFRLLAIGFIKPARLDYLIEKCTELGIGRFLLINSEHANYSTDNIQRLKKITRQAMKQSQRLFLPEITVCHSFSDLLEQTKFAEHKFIAEQGEYDLINDISLPKPANGQTSIVFAVGPEGGFSSREIEAAKNDGYKIIDFNTHRLRAETAAIFAAVSMNLWT